MLRMIPVLILLAAGCTSREKLGPDEFALLLQAKSGLYDLKLEVYRKVNEPRHTKYIGTGKDSEGKEYELRVDVSPDRVYWQAWRKLGAVTQEEAEALVRRKLHLDGISLHPESDGFEGTYVVPETQLFIRVREVTQILPQDTGIAITLSSGWFLLRQEFEPYPWFEGDFGL